MNTTYKRLKVMGIDIIHLGEDTRDGNYRTFCGKTIDTMRKKVSAQKVTEYHGDECALCRRKADGRTENVGGKPIVGTDFPGAKRFLAGAREKRLLLPRKSN